MKRFFLATLSCAVWATHASAHPHIFVAAGLNLRIDDSGAISAIDVSWRYDPLYSLLVLEDMELDPDFDGVLTPLETQTLDGFDLQWVEGFNGDIEVIHNGQLVDLGDPTSLGADLTAEHITTRHTRQMSEPQFEVQIRVFDESFYTAYDLTQGIEVPENCTVAVRPASLDDAYAAVEKAFEAVDFTDDDYPAVGGLFADILDIKCTAIS